MCTIVTEKNLQPTRLKDLRVTLLQKRYLATLINMGFELAVKRPLEDLRILKKHSNEQP